MARYADMWNGMGTPDVLRHKDEVLRAHCEDVGRDTAAIERTAGCKPIIRDTAEEAQRVWEAQMAHNHTPMSDVEDDDTFWVGTPEQVAARDELAASVGFTPSSPRWRRPTTTRRSSAGSVRSSRWSSVRDPIR